MSVSKKKSESEVKPPMDKTTKPFREHIIERLKTPEDAGGYLAASLQDNADCPEATGIVIQDIIAAFNLPLEVTSRASVAAPPPDVETLVKQWISTLQDESRVTDEDAEDLMFRIIAYANRGSAATGSCGPHYLCEPTTHCETCVYAKELDAASTEDKQT